jgi:hypothetical protein
MVSLNSGESSGALFGSDNSYSLNVEKDLGITSDVEKQKLVDLINATYKGQKIYFKFFFSLIESNASELGGCDGEYIDGYANLNKAELVSGEVKLFLIGTLPKQICVDYVKSEVGGKLLGKDCYGNYNNTPDPDGSIGSIKSAAQQLRNTINVAMGLESTCDIECQALLFAHSRYKEARWGHKG